MNGRVTPLTCGQRTNVSRGRRNNTDGIHVCPRILRFVPFMIFGGWQADSSDDRESRNRGRLIAAIVRNNENRVPPDLR